jgi:tyrosine-protein kinase
MPEFSGTKDLRSYLTILWRWKFLLLFFLIAAPLVAYLVDHGKPKVYQASALVGTNAATVSGPTGGSFTTNNIAAIARLVTTTPVAQIAGGLLHPPASPGQIVGEVSASADQTTGFLTISAQDQSPTRAAQIANAFAKAIGVNLQAAAINQINAAIRANERQLRRIPASQIAVRAQLQQQLTQLQASLATQGSGAAILQAAGPGSLVSGSPRRVIEIGLLIGLLLGIGAVALAENSDRRLRTPEDLERLTDLPLLGALAPSAFAFSGTGETTKEDDEAFHMLRTSLMFFNAEKRLQSVMITSAGEKDGKTTIATRLALVTAGSGLHVVLVDGDLRRAQVSSRLGLNRAAGLGAVIAGEETLAEALVDYPVEDHGTGRLEVLPAGPPPPNPSALMSSQTMQQILRELESRSDLVIIDTPAALAVSDPLPLMGVVSGVVLVARMNRSSRQTIHRLKKIIEKARGTILGVVATGVSAGPGYDHYYPKYYSTNGNGNGSHPHSPLSRLRKKHSDSSATSKPDQTPAPDAEGRSLHAGRRRSDQQTE